MSEFRCDVSRFKAARRTASGGLAIPGNLTRTGVFVYTRHDGSKVRELRLPEEVFNKDSLATLRGAPLTVGHPGRVTPDNWKSVTVGHVGEDAKPEGRFIAGSVLVQDAQTIAGVEGKTLGELSCGYDCDVEQKSGVFEGEHYDAIQRNIRYNHLAIGPLNGFARGGPEVALRQDSAFTEIAFYTESMDFEKLYKEACARLDALEKQIAADAKKAADEAQARFDALKTENDQLKQDAAKFDEKVEKAVSEKLTARTARADLESAAAVVVSDLKCDGKSDREVMEACLSAVDKTIRFDGKSDDYLRARFDLAVEKAREDAKSLAGLREASTPRQDGEGAVDMTYGRSAMLERNQKAWRN